MVKSLFFHWHHQRPLAHRFPIYSPDFPDNSVGKESACNAGDPGSIPGSGRSTGEETGYPFQYSCGSAGKEFASNLGDLGLIAGLERYPGEGKDYPL